MKRRYTIDEKLMLVDRDGQVLGRVVGITIDDAPVGGNGGSSTSSSSSTTEENTSAGGESARGEELAARVQEIWDHYRQVFAAVDGVDPSRMALNATRARVIRNALKVRTVEQCKLAIDGLARSPWHLGENDAGKKYLDIRYALKGNSQRGESNEERIDKMAALAESEPASRETGSSRLPDGVSREMIIRRLEAIRAHVSSGHKFEPTRAAEAREQLEQWDLEVVEHKAHPWATLKWKEASDG